MMGEMTDPDRQALTTERADLQRKLEAREGQPGYGANVVAIKQRLAEIDALIAQ
jgi:hypothetical protein